jgi:hypothetical protein
MGRRTGIVTPFGVVRPTNCCTAPLCRLTVSVAAGRSRPFDEGATGSGARDSGRLGSRM